jgi:hypothetical protein
MAMRKRTVADLERTLGRALARAHRLDSRAQSSPARAPNYRASARQARKIAGEIRERISIMKRNMESPPTMVPPHAGWRLTAFRTLSLGGKTIQRGAEISTADLAQMANAPALLAGGHVRWCPPAAAAVTPRALPQTVAPSDPVDPEYATLCQAQDAVRAAAEKRRTDRRTAIDLIDRTLLDRAGTVWGQWPRLALVGSWGSGGGSLKRVGALAPGITSRHSDDFIDMLVSNDRPPPRLANEARAS